MSNQSSYYDLDAILAEEELVPVSNLLRFSYLAHLDPDYFHHRPNVRSSTNEYNAKVSVHQSPTSLSQASTMSQATLTSSSKNGDRNSRKRRNTSQYTNYLPENTIFKMPLWSIHKWAELNFIQISLPKHYNRKGREKLETDPVSINLNEKSERFYMAGMTFIDLIHQIVNKFLPMNEGRRSSSRNNPQIAMMNRLYNESQELKRTLLLTYTGPRLRQTFNWTMSSNTEDDVSSYTKKLTEMERRLFQCSSDASYAFMMWKLYGSHRIVVSETAMRAKVMSVNRNTQNQSNRSGGKMMTTTPKGGMKGKRSTARLISPENETNLIGGRKRMRSH